MARLPPRDVTDGMSAEALNGDDLSFTVSEGSVMVNDATVTSADVMASNGIIHVIDKVLMPPADLGDIPTVAQGTGIHILGCRSSSGRAIDDDCRATDHSRSSHQLTMHSARPGIEK